MKVFFDFETRSTAELKAVGAHVYAKDKTTDVVCLAWAIDNGPVKIYRHLDGDQPPAELFHHIQNGSQFYAHNAQFERVIWQHVCHERYGWPALPLKQLNCTMVMSYSMGLMGSLEDAAGCVGLDSKKDMRGNRVMLQLAKPRSVCKQTGSIHWWNRADSTPKLDINEKYESVYRYCMQDIIVTRELEARLLPLDPVERATWELDQEINDRGVYIDFAAARNAINLAELEIVELNKKIRKLTKQFVPSVNAHLRLKEWLNQQKIKLEDGSVLEVEGCDKAAVHDLLELNLPKVVRQVLEIRQDAAKSSVNKLNRMLDSRDQRGRSQGCFQYYGAASTGRWAGRRIQLQNLPRPSINQQAIEDVLDKLGRVGVNG